MDTVLIFIKNPELGKVKTRLAATVGDEKALQIYLALLQHTRGIAQSLPVQRLLFYSNFIEEADAWPAEEFEKRVQAPGHLGVRMAQAFQQAFKDAADRVVIIGSDCASLTKEVVLAAFDLLHNHDFVVGPALDGGYYLLGMRSFHPEVFEGIAWSTEEVFPTTIERIKGLGKTYALLPTLSDIDYEEDWEKYGW